LDIKLGVKAFDIKNALSIDSNFLEEDEEKGQDIFPHPKDDLFQ